jgi:hypothetical protein
MSLPKLMQRGILAALFLGPGQALLCQVLIKGTVFDRSERFPLQAVSVMGSSGAGASTDSLGHYSIRLTFSDSIYFSYLGKSSAKSPVRDINPDKPFDVSMQETMDSLVPVSVQSKNYIRDSASIRAEYKKVFDYESDYLENMKSGAKGKGMGVGLDMDMILDNKANTRMLTLQQRLEKEEQDN